jgi:quercetin dioxygenase-like cupin family protein
MDYKFIPDPAAEFAMPKDGIMSRVLHKDEKLSVTLFGFSTGQELSTHSAPTPALLYFLQGEADVRLGDDIVDGKPGSFIGSVASFKCRQVCRRVSVVRS